MYRKALIISLISVSIATFASAATREVPSVYGTIQAAIDAAVNGVDDVNVAPGVYSGLGNRDLDFGGKAIVVHSADPNDPNVVANTIIDCDDRGRGFYFWQSEGRDSVVEGFTIVNGNASNVPFATGYGGAIECEMAEPTIRNCVMRGNKAQFGGAIDIWFAHPKIENCVIEDNTAQYGGGLELIYADADTVIRNCLLKGNTAGALGGAIDCGDSDPNIINCTVVENTDSGASGGMYADFYSFPIIQNSIFWDNSGDLDLVSTVGVIFYSCIEDGDSNGVNGNIFNNPVFRTGPLGDYYLSQPPGQTQISPCVDTGSDFASALGLNEYTTRSDDAFNAYDVGIVDIGYHYPMAISFDQEQQCRFCDFVFDGIVNLTDLSVLASYWLDTCTAGNDYCEGASTGVR